MSVRVNLLPEATKERSAATRQRGVVGGAALVFLMILGGLYLWFASLVTDAEEELVAEQLRTSQLRADQAELIAFADLDRARQDAVTLLREALGAEATVAGVLQDLAAVIPEDAQFDSLALQFLAGVDETVPTVGTFNVGGRSLTSHAPGVERVLIALDRVATLEDLYLNSSSLDGDDTDVVSFSVDGSIGAEARTERYLDGVPEELR